MKHRMVLALALTLTALGPAYANIYARGHVVVGDEGLLELEQVNEQGRVLIRVKDPNQARLLQGLAGSEITVWVDGVFTNHGRAFHARKVRDWEPYEGPILFAEDREGTVRALSTDLGREFIPVAGNTELAALAVGRTVKVRGWRSRRGVVVEALEVRPKVWALTRKRVGKRVAERSAGAITELQRFWATDVEDGFVLLRTRSDRSAGFTHKLALRFGSAPDDRHAKIVEKLLHQELVRSRTYEPIPAREGATSALGALGD